MTIFCWFFHENSMVDLLQFVFCMFTRSGIWIFGDLWVKIYGWHMGDIDADFFYVFRIIHVVHGDFLTTSPTRFFSILQSQIYGKWYEKLENIPPIGTFHSAKRRDSAMWLHWYGRLKTAPRCPKVTAINHRHLGSMDNFGTVNNYHCNNFGTVILALNDRWKKMTSRIDGQ